MNAVPKLDSFVTVESCSFLAGGIVKIGSGFGGRAGSAVWFVILVPSHSSSSNSGNSILKVSASTGIFAAPFWKLVCAKLQLSGSIHVDNKTRRQASKLQALTDLPRDKTVLLNLKIFC